MSWESKLRLSSISRVPSTQSPERPASPPQISQFRHPLCLAQNQHAPAVQSGQTAVSRPPQSVHMLFGALKVSSTSVRYSPKSQFGGTRPGPASEIPSGAPIPWRKVHPVSTVSITAIHISSFLCSIWTASSSGFPSPSCRKPPLKRPPYAWSRPIVIHPMRSRSPRLHAPLFALLSSLGGWIHGGGDVPSRPSVHLDRKWALRNSVNEFV